MSIWILLGVAALLFVIITRSQAKGGSQEESRESSAAAGNTPARGRNSNDITASVRVAATPAAFSPTSAERRPAGRIRRTWMRYGKEAVDKKRIERGNATIYSPTQSQNPLPKTPHPSPKSKSPSPSPKSKSPQQSPPAQGRRNSI